MQTFIPFKNINKSIKCLDKKRLGKQRVEAIQIARALLGLSNGWKNHPAAKMWLGYESYLVRVYLRKVMDRWLSLKCDNIKCEVHYKQLIKLVSKKCKKPKWINKEFCISHQSNLLRKKPEHYKKYFKNVPNDLEYIWPNSAAVV